MREFDRDECVAFAQRFLKGQRDYRESAAEQRRRAYKNLPARGRGDFLRDLLSDSNQTKKSWDAVNLIAQDLLRAGELLPPELAEWTSDVLADQFAKRDQKRRRRPTKGDDVMGGRDWTICNLVDLLVKWYGLNPTGNEATDSELPSACDVVAAAMDSESPKVKTVERIWTMRSRLTSLS